MLLKPLVTTKHWLPLVPPGWKSTCATGVPNGIVNDSMLVSSSPTRTTLVTEVTVLLRNRTWLVTQTVSAVPPVVLVWQTIKRFLEMRLVVQKTRFVARNVLVRQRTSPPALVKQRTKLVSGIKLV